MPLLTTVVAALLGAALLEALRVPAGAMVGAMIGVALVNLVGPVDVVELPAAARFLSFAALGWLLGVRLDASVLRTVGDNLGFVVLVVVGILGAGAVLAFVGARVVGLSGPTALLASAPGGLTEMSAIASATGANVGLVVAAHLVRLVAVVALTPLVARFALGGDG